MHTHAHAHTHNTHTNMYTNKRALYKFLLSLQVQIGHRAPVELNYYVILYVGDTVCEGKLTICPLTDGIVVGGVCCTVAVNTCLHQSEWSIVTTVPWIILQLRGKRQSHYTDPQVNEKRFTDLTDTNKLTYNFLERQ